MEKPCGQPRPGVENRIKEIFIRGEPVSTAAALASPHRIKQKRRRVRWRTSGRTVYAYVGNNPTTTIDPLGLCGCTLSQKIAAKLGSFFGAASNVTGAFATTTGALTLAAAGAELPSGGTDTPVTAGLAVVTARAATVSTVTALASAGFNAYASGNISSFRGFLAGEISSGAIGILASHLPGVSAAATDYLKNAAGLVAGNAADTKSPCQ